MRKNKQTNMCKDFIWPYLIEVLQEVATHTVNVGHWGQVQDDILNLLHAIGTRKPGDRKREVQRHAF